MLEDNVIETWMGMMLHEAKETNKKLGQIRTLLASPPATKGDDLLAAIGSLGGDLAPAKLIKRAALEVEKKDDLDAAKKKAEATHVEHKCPACGHGHVWDLHPYTKPGLMYVEFVRSEEDRKSEPLDDEPVHLTEAGIKAFVEGQLCAKCQTPMTAYVDSSRAAAPVVSVNDMYGLSPQNNPPTPDDAAKAAAGAVDPAAKPSAPAKKPAAPRKKKKAAPGKKKAPAPKKKGATRKRKRRK